MNKTEQLAGLIAGAYLKENGINSADTVLDGYNKQGIEDDEAIMLIVISSFYNKSIYRKKLK